MGSGVEVPMRVLVTFSGVARLVALGFALGIVVGLYFGLGGRSEPGVTQCGTHCVAPTTTTSGETPAPPVDAAP
jgi:hypothetical protein